MGYIKTAAKGVSWVSAFRYITRGIAFGREILLARILTPSQYGVVGIASLVLSFLEILTETGINVFLIQKKDNYQKYLNTAWGVSILRGLVISLVIALLAQPISQFFNSPQSYHALLLISIVPFIRGFINPAIVRLQKDLLFAKEFWFRLVIFVFDTSVAVIATVVTTNPLGIIVGLVAGSILELVLSYVVIKPWPTLRISLQYVGEVIGSGKWLTGAGIFQFLFRQGDDAVVGKLLGEGPLGLYQMAYKISTLPISEITDVFNRVALPLYVKISDSKQRLMRAFIINTAVVIMLSTIMGAAIFIFADPLVRIALGDQWLSIIPLLRILSIFGIIQAITNSIHSLLLALEQQKYVTLLTGVSIIAMAIVIIPLTNRYQLTGAAVSPLIGSLIALPFLLFTLKRSLHTLKA